MWVIKLKGVCHRGQCYSLTLSKKNFPRLLELHPVLKAGRQAGRSARHAQSLDLTADQRVVVNHISQMLAEVVKRPKQASN